jgi:hypothetical protein
MTTKCGSCGKCGAGAPAREKLRSDKDVRRKETAR